MGWRMGLTKTWLLGHLEWHPVWWLCDCSARNIHSFSISPVNVELQIRSPVFRELTKWQTKPSVSSLVVLHWHSHFRRHRTDTEQMLVLQLNFHHLGECLCCVLPDNHTVATNLFSQIHLNISVNMWYSLSSVHHENIRYSLKVLCTFSFIRNLGPT